MSFLARHNPLVIPPVAILLGGLVASGGLIQRRMDLPDATVLVLQGLIFVVLLTSETLYGRFAIFRPAKRTGPHMNDAVVTVLIAMLGGAIRVSTPFMFVALGECLTEKSGRVNLGLEGTLVLGAMVAYAASYHTGTPWLGVARGRRRRLGARRHARLDLRPAAGQRRRGRHRHDAVRRRRRVLLRQALHPADGAAARLDPARDSGPTTPT